MSHALFAKMDKEGWRGCAEDFPPKDPAQPRPGRGGMAALQGGGRSRSF